MQDSVQAFQERARAYFYEVMLSGHSCPRCDGTIRMIREGESACVACQAPLDPTLAFQRCSSCGGPPKLKIRRYVCGKCAQDIHSQFLFDGLVFDAEYFRQKMAEHRYRKEQLRERVHAMLAGTRSGAVKLLPIGQGDQAGLFAALDAMNLEAFRAAAPEFCDRFDLTRYQTHIRGHLQTIPINLNQIPPLSENTRLDRIWRFIAVIFLAHAGQARIWQEDDTIMVMKLEINREGQTIYGDSEDLDGLGGPLGRVEA